MRLRGRSSRRQLRYVRDCKNTRVDMGLLSICFDSPFVMMVVMCDGDV
jgi:hypothetical protein